MQDAYTTTDNYPYSTPTQTRSGSINYIRNSVKIVIDAYNGTMTFYLAEPTDPIALTIAKIFPGMLQPMSEMPTDLRQHVRYPEDIFKIQTADVHDVPHDEPAGLLQQGRPVAGADARHRAERHGRCSRTTR